MEGEGGLGHQHNIGGTLNLVLQLGDEGLALDNRGFVLAQDHPERQEGHLQICST